VTEHLLMTLAGILVLGVGAQWIAWRLRLPSILMLLVIGFLAGPLLGWIDPDVSIGPLLFPLVSLSVGVILFEGGLTLSAKELASTGRVIRNLITSGALVAWLGASFAAWWLLDMSPSLAFLFGAILVVTGPTVVGPLLRHVAPKGRVGSIIKWEGILIDPVGATLAVLLFETILARGVGHATVLALSGLVMTVIAGGLAGCAGALVFVVAMRRRLIPDFLENAFTLMLVVAVQTSANHMQHEAGLLAVTVLGVALANQRAVDVRGILDFKKNLQVLLLAGLFIVLAARMRLDDFRGLGQEAVLFLAVLILVVRPLTVIVATWKSDLDWRERVFLANLAPRGIVAAAVSALFSMRLAEAGIPGASTLAAYTFLVIVGTVTFYGLTAKPVARWLGLADANPQGLLILGAHEWARALAAVVQESGFRVTLVDTNAAAVERARAEGLKAVCTNILADSAGDALPESGYNHFVALTSNPEVNALACHKMNETFGRSNVYQFLAPTEGTGRRDDLTQKLRGRPLFGMGVTYDYVSRRFAEGDVMRRSVLTETFDFDAFERRYGKSAVHMLLVDPHGKLSVVTAEQRVHPRAGVLISLVTPHAERSAVELPAERGPVARPEPAEAA
jgi:NhaP-type Na+/H+ or K+/H+ antiporter